MNEPEQLASLATAPLAGIRSCLDAAEMIVVTAHDRPDGDALGATLGLARSLAAAGRPVRLTGCQPVTERYRCLLAGESFGEVEPGAPGAVLVVLDCGSPERAAAVPGWRASGGELINIDHHASNGHYGTLNWVDRQACSASELVLALIRHCRWPLPQAAAEALWAGIVTDTGRFTYENTGATALHAAAYLVAHGVSPGHMGEMLYQNKPVVEVHLASRAIQTLGTAHGGQVAWVMLSRRDFEELGCGPEDSGDVVNLPRNMAGVRVALFFYEVPSAALTKVSIRTSQPFDAIELARRFDGGGHPRAAGGARAAGLCETRQAVLAAVDELWGETLRQAIADGGEHE